MLKHTTLLHSHESRDIETLCDAELGTVTYTCTNHYLCHVTDRTFCVKAHGSTKDEAIRNCTPPTFDDSVRHFTDNNETYSIDFDRLREAMETESFIMPYGLTREQKRAYIKACANETNIAE